MATYAQGIRRGLPRTVGGEPWPPVPEGVTDTAPVADAAPPGSEVAPVGDASAPPVNSAPAAVEPAGPGPSAVPAAGANPPRAIRRGLPRVAGGPPWPPAPSVDTAPSAGGAAADRGAIAAGEGAAPVAPAAAAGSAAAAPVPGGAGSAAQPSGSADVAATGPVAPASAVAGRTLRRGLPRVAGGPPWPPEAVVPTASAQPPATPTAQAQPAQSPTAQAQPPAAQPAQAQPPAPATPAAAPIPAAAEASTPRTLEPLPFRSSVSAGSAAARWRADRERALATRTPIARAEPRRHGPFTAAQWAGAIIVAGAGLIVAAGMLVLLIRWWLSTPAMQQFLTTYPGAYDLPHSAPVGFAAWVNWQHFFNIFLMVLIIRSGLTVHYQKRPTVFWSPKRNPARKVSIAVWLHQSLDILWIVNGVVFIVLLFASGQWMRLVPTSWDVFPNALSAGLQYLSMDWPIEDGWVNYNSLQQLAYFAIVFVAAPLAVLTGVRMSGIWPSKAKRLSAAYPVEWARAVHFPVMVVFVLFIIGHVFLVLTTGALRNLNTMFAARSGEGWTGFWLFIAALAVVAIGWVAARPLVLAPIARLFGRVSGR